MRLGVRESQSGRACASEGEGEGVCVKESESREGESVCEREIVWLCE